MSKAKRQRIQTLRRRPIKESFTSSIVSTMRHRLPHPGCALPDLIFMVLVLLFGFQMLFVSLILITRGTSTTGTVIKYSTSSFGCSGTDFYDVLFTTSDGKQVTLEKSVRTCDPVYQVGDTVPILYNSDSPKEARIVTFFNLWGLPILSIIFGAVGCLIFGVVSTVFIKQLLQRRCNKKRLLLP